jgi:hypothetical protein
MLSSMVGVTRRRIKKGSKDVAQLPRVRKSEPRVCLFCEGWQEVNCPIRPFKNHFGRASEQIIGRVRSGV